MEEMNSAETDVWCTSSLLSIFLCLTCMCYDDVLVLSSLLVSGGVIGIGLNRWIVCINGGVAPNDEYDQVWPTFFSKHRDNS